MQKNRLPLRNWRKTKNELSRVGKVASSSYNNFNSASRKVKDLYSSSREGVTELRETGYEIQERFRRVGVERAVLGQKSIYSERPTQAIKRKSSDLKKRFFGGSIYDED